MKRILEPEIMDGKEQVEAYSLADFQSAHNSYVTEYKRFFADKKNQNFIDLGCGPGDVVFRFLDNFPQMEFVAIDASTPMLELAKRDKRYSRFKERVTFRQCFLDSLLETDEKYEGITSSSLLHHLHNPDILWKTVAHLATKGKTIVFVADLLRPNSQEDAQNIINTYAKDEPQILQTDFYNSLLAAFTKEEIEQQLEENELSQLKVHQISDRHVIIAGVV